MILTFAVPRGTVDPALLDAELVAALGEKGTKWAAQYVDEQPAVTLAQGNAALAPTIEAVIAAHVAASTARALAALALQEADAAAIASAKASDTVKYLVSHTPDECAALIQTTVTDLPGVIGILAEVARTLSVLARVSLR